MAEHEHWAASGAGSGADFDDEFEPLSWRDRTYNRFQRVRFTIYALIVAVLLLIGLLWSRVFILVESGHHAVLYQPLRDGTVTDPDRLYGEGLHVMLPWNRLYIYETRLQQKFLEVTMLSDEGLALEVVVSVRYRPKRDMLGFLHQDIGTEYFARLIHPQIEAHVRETLGHRPAYEIYSSAGDLIQELNHVTSLTRLGDSESPYVIVQEVELVRVLLPGVVEQAIADRYRQEQLRLEYEDRLIRAEQEAERKRIEARGIADYKEIIGKDVLRWRDIEAVKALANSPNTKVIMLGNGAREGGQPPLIFSLSGEGEQTTSAANQRASDQTLDGVPAEAPMKRNDDARDD